MSAWIEDAQVLTEVRELNWSEHSVLLRTTAVQEFLENVNLSSHAVVAPKGFGKTFVLKLKRVSLQDNGYRCFPLSPIVDRPSNRPPILPTEIINFLENSENWEILWQISFCICIIKGFQEEPDVKKQISYLLDARDLNPTLSTIISHPYINNPFDVLHDCISAQRSEIFSTLSLAQNFTRIFSTIHKKAAIFVDNIDEYLVHYINFAYVRQSAIHENFVRIWHAGQIGAWLALRRLQGINPHIRIFISIRKEAYHYAQGHEPDFANLRSFRRELTYKRDDIRQIIENNVSAESASKLVEKNNRSPILKFLGSKNEFISNSGTAKQETAIDYWIRHCSTRPRDAVAVGREISLIRPSERSQQSIRSAINAAAAERVEALFSEVAPFFSALYPDIFPRVLKSNVLNQKAILEASQAYASIASEQYETVPDVDQPFSALYAMGLIGIVQQSRDDPRMLVQSFAAVGEVPFGSGSALPEAETYVVHPSLSDFIIRRNVGLLKTLSRNNVIGDGLEWRAEEELRFVAIGDIRGFRELIMQNVGGAQTFDRYWNEVFRQLTSNLDYAITSSGDRLIIADRSPSLLLRAAQGLLGQLENSGYHLQMRIGAHSGFWRLNQELEGIAQPEISDVVGVAARIEPLARPGDILLSQQFVDDANRCGYDLDQHALTIVDDNYVDAARYEAGVGVLISREGREAPQRMSLYKVGRNMVR